MKKLLSIALLTAATSGCVTVYSPPPGIETAQINIKKAAGIKWICIDGKQQQVRSDAEGYAAIPVGSRVTIGTDFSLYGYQITWSCSPRSSLIPERGRKYFLDFQMETDYCTAFIYREDPSRPRVPLAMEPSLRAASRCGA